jgi:hypothetical protein
MDMNAIANVDGRMFATACCITATIMKQSVSFFENFRQSQSFIPAYPDEVFVQEMPAQIVLLQSFDSFLPQLMAKLPSKCNLIRTFPALSIDWKKLEAQICAF